MGNRADLLAKLDGHIKAYNEHITKAATYPHKYDKEFALKTAERIKGEIDTISRQLNSGPSVKVCTTCGKIH